MSDYSWTNFFEILLKFVWSTHIPSMAMTLDTQMTLALFEELLMALRANDVDGYKSWLVLGIEELGRDVLVRLSLTGWCPYWWKREGQAYWE